MKVFYYSKYKKTFFICHQHRAKRIRTPIFKIKWSNELAFTMSLQGINGFALHHHHHHHVYWSCQKHNKKNAREMNTNSSPGFQACLWDASTKSLVFFFCISLLLLWLVTLFLFCFIVFTCSEIIWQSETPFISARSYCRHKLKMNKVEQELKKLESRRRKEIERVYKNGKSHKHFLFLNPRRS